MVLKTFHTDEDGCPKFNEGIFKELFLAATMCRKVRPVAVRRDSRGQVLCL